MRECGYWYALLLQPWIWDEPVTRAYAERHAMSKLETERSSGKAQWQNDTGVGRMKLDERGKNEHDEK